MVPIVTLTINPALDVTVPVDKVVSGPKLRCGAPRLDPGGGGINVSRVLHRLGVPTIALYAVGGLTGGRLRALIDQEGFAHRPIAVAGETRESFTAQERNTGRQYRFVLPGPELSANEWQGLLETTIELAEKTDLAAASGSLPPGVPDDFYARLAAALDERGVRLILDSSGPGLATTLARAHVHLVKPNINEIVELAGEELAWPEGQADWASRLIAQGRSDIVLVTHGADGALVVTGDRRVRIKPPAMRVQSAVGAGDSFTAGLCAGLVRGQSVIEASAWAWPRQRRRCSPRARSSAIPRTSSACALRSKFLTFKRRRGSQRHSGRDPADEGRLDARPKRSTAVRNPIWSGAAAVRIHRPTVDASQWRRLKLRFSCSSTIGPAR